MKYIRSFAIGALALLALAGLRSILTAIWAASPAEQRATPTLISQWQELPTVVLDCIESRDDGLAPQRWPQAVVWSVSVVRVVPNGLVSDGDLLWISTHRGLIRLDTRAFECTIFTQAAQLSLAGAYLLLPDGAGGLWVGVEQGLLHFSGEQWELAFKIPDTQYPPRIRDVGLRQDGDFCVVTHGGRTNYVSHFCFREDQLPQTGAARSKGPLDFTDCRQWQRAAVYSHVFTSWDDGVPLGYVTPARCEQIAAQTMPGYLFSAISPRGDEIWGIKDGRLFHQREETVEEIKVPYVDVHALAADPLHGGVWMATEYGLVRAQAGEGEARYDFQPFTFNPGMLALVGYNFYYARALAVDTSGQMWLASKYSLLRYDEVAGDWLDVFKDSIEDMDDYYLAIAADPVRGGVWVAGLEKLMHFDGARWRVWPMALDEQSSHYYNSSTALLVDASGRVWVGRSHTGVWMTLPSTQFGSQEPPVLDWRHFTVQDGLADEKITALAHGPDGRIYAAHYAGISVFVPASGGLDPADGIELGCWITLPGSDANEKGWVNALAFDQATGELWVGYHIEKSLRRYKDGRWTTYPVSFSKHSIGALLVDDDGALWIGSSEGLWRWPVGDPSRSQAFDPDLHGPFIRNVVALAQDNQGRIWAGGREGVATLKE